MRTSESDGVRVEKEWLWENGVCNRRIVCTSALASILILGAGERVGY